MDRVETRLTELEDFKKMTEKILVDNLTNIIWQAIPNKNGCKYPIVLREVDCHRGRADVLCAVLQNNEVQSMKFREMGQALSQPSKATITTWLNNKASLDERQLSRSTGFGLRTIRKHLNELLELGLVTQKPSGKWVKSREFQLPKIDIWAFEVKLNNWKRAYYQALRYRGFAHYTTVVMPVDRVKKPTEKKEFFQQANIGLMSIDVKQHLKFIVKPRREIPSSKTHYYYAMGQIIAEFCRLYPHYDSNNKFCYSFILPIKKLLSQFLYRIGLSTRY